MTTLLQDLRYALRTLRHAPGFATIAIATLALGIGATTAILSLVNATLLRDLPYPEADRIVRVHQTVAGRRTTVSPPDFTDWRKEADAFSGMASYVGFSFALTGVGEARQVGALGVTGDFFSVLGVKPILGRLIGPSDAEVQAERVVVISERLWRRDFGADPDLIGRQVMLDAQPYTVIGVMPAWFDYPRDREVWVPDFFSEEVLSTQRGAHYLSVIGRLKPGVTIEQASAQVAAIANRLAIEYPTSNRETSAEAISLREQLVGDADEMLALLGGAVALVLLIACANVANLLVARALSRRRDLALRQAVGASRGRLTRLVLVESLVLAVAGGLFGVILAAWGTPLLAQLRPDDAFLQAATIDWRVLGMTAVVCLASGVLFGTFPALRLIPSIGFAQHLAGGRGSALTAEAHRARRLLATAEMTLAFVLLVGSGLLLRSFASLYATELGFDTTSRLTFSLSAPEAQYDTPEKLAGYFASVEERLAALGGVHEVGATMVLPLSGDSYGISMHSLDGRELEDEEEDRLSTQIRVVTPGYLEAMGIALIRGRTISENDRHGSPHAVVVSKSAADLIFPGEDPIGHEIRMGTTFGIGRGRAGGSIVGVVADTRDFGAANDHRPTVYLSHDQFPVSAMEIVVRTNREARSLMNSVRSTVASIDPNVPVFGLQTMDDLFAQSVSQPRFMLTLIGLFALLAVVLAAVGLYGVTAYGVSERTREIGIRLALGARARDVERMILRSGGIAAILAIGAGLVATVWVGRLLRSYLYGVEPLDIASIVGAILILLPIALLASWIPARRATRVDPAITLRTD